MSGFDGELLNGPVLRRSIPPMMRESLNRQSATSMGRGLAAILSASEHPGDDDIELRDVPVELIEPSPRQPRRRFDEQELLGLASSLRERGVLQPVLVRPLPGGRYELVAGERRWRAARMASLATVPALVRVRDDATALELALIENVARADLSPIEEARACAALVEELGVTQAELGRRTGRSRVAVANLLRLLDLPDEVIELLDDRTLTAGHGRALLMAPDAGTRVALARTAARQALSVREVERRARAASPHDPGPIAVTRRPARDAEAERVAVELGELLGGAVRIRRRPSGGVRAQLDLDSLDAARALADRLRAVQAARV